MRTWADNSVVMTDVTKTISASHTFSAAQTFSSTINGQTISAAASFTGNLAAAGEVSGAAMTISGAAGAFRSLQMATGSNLRWVFTGTNEAEGGANAGTNLACKRYADAGTVIEDAFTISRATGAMTIAKGVTITAGGLTITAGGLTVSAGGAGITGNTTITGNLTVTGTFTAVGTVVSQTLASDFTTTSASAANTPLSVGGFFGEEWRLDFDLAINCDNTGGVVLAFETPSGATGRVSWSGATSSHTAVYNRTTTSFNSVQSWSTFNSAASSDGVYVRATMYVLRTFAGAITLRINSVTGGQTSKVLAGSTVLATRIA